MMLADQTTAEELSSVDLAIAWHNGDARAAIETLIMDCEFLRGQLSLAHGCISKGLTRGWLPLMDRTESLG